jgi:hypothetical protein
MRCPHCSGTMANDVKALEAVQGEHGALKLSLDGLPARTCPKGHHAPADGDVMFWLIQELKARIGKLPGGEEKGLLLKKHLCGECGRELASKPDHRETVAERLTYDGKYAFGAVLDLGMHKCPGCGKSQLRSVRDAQKDVSHAMVAVTDRAGFPHSG